MSTDSLFATYNLKGEMRKRMRAIEGQSASERAAHAPRQVMPRDEAPGTPLS